MREINTDGIIDCLQYNILGNLCVSPVEYLQCIEHLAAAVTLAVNDDVGQCRRKPETAGSGTVRDA